MAFDRVHFVTARKAQSSPSALCVIYRQRATPGALGRGLKTPLSKPYEAEVKASIRSGRRASAKYLPLRLRRIGVRCSAQRLRPR